MKFIDNEGNEHPFYRQDKEKAMLKIQSPPKSIDYAIRLASVTFPAGMYNPYKDATTWEISRWLYSRGLSLEAAIFASDEGYKLFQERK